MVSVEQDFIVEGALGFLEVMRMKMMESRKTMTRPPILEEMMMMMNQSVEVEGDKPSL